MASAKTKCKSYDEANINHYILKRGWLPKGREDTHFLLNNGKLHVPMNEYDDFIEIIGEHLDNGVVNFITERRTPIFNFHADLDIYQPPEQEMTEELIDLWIREIQSVITDFFHEVDDEYSHVVIDKLTGRSFHRLSVLVCTAPTKYDFERNKKMWTKTGIHLVWPWIRVTSEDALRIRAGFVQHFQNKFGLRPKDWKNPWEDVFDHTIYGPNGLRMVGSDKMDPCPECKLKPSKDGFCPLGLCNGKDGRYASNRVYRVTAAYNGEGTFSKKLLRTATSRGAIEIGLTKIRTTAIRTTPMQVPEWFNYNFYMDDRDKQRAFNPTAADRRKNREALGKTEDNIESARDLGITRAPKIDKEDDRVKLLQRWLRESEQPSPYLIPEPYRKTQIVDVVHKVSEDGGSYYLARTDSRFCLNKGDEHAQSGIYFYISTSGLYQKCFCRKDTTEGRANGKCKDWRSFPVRLPMKVRAAFFPQYHERMQQANRICMMEDLYDTIMIRDPEARKAVIMAEREILDQQIAEHNARKKAEYQDSIRSKRG